METNEIKVIDNDFDYENIPACVEVIVNGSFEKNGDYHSYLFDYSYASVILKMFTDYSGEYEFGEIIQIYGSKRWIEIENEVGNGLCNLINYYARREIEIRNTAAYGINKVANKISQLIDNVNNTIDQFNNDKVKSFIENLDVDAVNKFAKLIGG